MNFNLCTTPVQSSIKILQTELGLFEGQKWDHCLGRPSPLKSRTPFLQATGVCVLFTGES